MSKNFQLAQNWARDASHHEFAVQPGSIIIGNNQPYGSPTISQSTLGVTVPNVQAAIDDLYTLSLLPINSIIINDDGQTPQAVAQLDDFKFIGTIKDSTKQPGDPVQIDFHGFPVTVKIGNNGEEVAAAVKLQLELAKSAGLVFDSVAAGATLDILRVSYLDCQTHKLPTLVQFSMSITQTTISPAKSGYGTWEIIGTQTVTFDAPKPAKKLTYFKRIA